MFTLLVNSSAVSSFVFGTGLWALVGSDVLRFTRASVNIESWIKVAGARDRPIRVRVVALSI